MNLPIRFIEPPLNFHLKLTSNLKRNSNKYMAYTVFVTSPFNYFIFVMQIVVIPVLKFNEMNAGIGLAYLFPIFH